MYWVMRSMRTSDEDLIIHGQPKTIEALRLRFNQGSRIPYRFKKIVIDRKKEHIGNYTDNLLAYGVPGLLLNSKIRGILKSHRVQNIEYYEAIVEDDLLGVENEDYMIANVIGLIKCVDMDASDIEIDEDDGSIEEINKLILDEQALKDNEFQIFRLEEFKPIVMVHDSIKQAFESENVTGVGFVDPKKFVL